MSGAQAHTIGLAYGGPILIAPLGGTGFVVLLCFVLFWFCFGLFCVYFPTVDAAGRCIHPWRCPIGHTRAYSHIFICMGSHTHTHIRTYTRMHWQPVLLRIEVRQRGAAPYGLVGACAGMYTCMHVSIRVCTCVLCVRVCARIRAHARTHAHTHAHSHTHTHAHTHTLSLSLCHTHTHTNTHAHCMLSKSRRKKQKHTCLLPLRRRRGYTGSLWRPLSRRQGCIQVPGRLACPVCVPAPLAQGVLL